MNHFASEKTLRHNRKSYSFNLIVLRLSCQDPCPFLCFYTLEGKVLASHMQCVRANHLINKSTLPSSLFLSISEAAFPLQRKVAVGYRLQFVCFCTSLSLCTAACHGTLRQDHCNPIQACDKSLPALLSSFPLKKPHLLVQLEQTARSEKKSCDAISNYQT